MRLLRKVDREAHSEWLGHPVTVAVLEALGARVRELEHTAAQLAASLQSQVTLNIVGGRWVEAGDVLKALKEVPSDKKEEVE